ncbi:hypothetical protein CY34DRAFT_17193 [Suillus luteus UH-Slu-Lm8-n1]|uniref:Cation/H+ exchanger transmembrane domain-containing protein n=1 Tax=Suillus luteus UH-Slu-Lm8-n1 TaxID=930992 RepID=A0A0C9ZC97_9AGAM|nr:hypothetical protein CY34DRAFT_17193 [Suillus luteus UH-Slu-Lm8-n1]
MRDMEPKTATARHACVTGDLSTAEKLLTQYIHTDANDYTSYADRSFVMARQHDWDHAHDDAIKANFHSRYSPSAFGISKGIALCVKGLIWEARAAFDVAFMFTNHFLFLVKAIALSNAVQREEAMILVMELAAACPNADLLGCRVVSTYLRVQLRIDAFDGVRHDEAADHLTAAVNSSAFSSKFKLNLVVLFGWDLEALWLTAHQKRCQAFLSAGKSHEALEVHKYMIDAINEPAKASCFEWSNGKSSLTPGPPAAERCNALAVQDDRILGAEIPGQDQDGYDAEPIFFHGMHQHSRPRPQQRHRRLWVLLTCVAFTMLLLFIVKRVMLWLTRATGSTDNGPTMFYMTVVMTCAFFTDIMGVNAIISAFLAGVIVPREGSLAIPLTEKLDDVASVIFLPLYVLRRAFAQSETDVALFVDPGNHLNTGAGTGGSHHIFFPFFGGPDDRLALEFLCY